ncbi:MBL fold metallo-hydrolase [Halomicrobium urmianum]|uniref:MBL fold metallo-hydrolase n=1 Tax=Halomicrobium urmianum TaxID=1586233 RepID=UPI001CD97ECD|nr:MBL fold metallo-hydrolase [Halomicrobium urmianum]
MGIGDVYQAEEVDPDLHYVDTGMYDVPEYGSVYVIDAERPALVDTGIGTDHERVLAALDEVGLDPADIEVLAVTHVHLDHAGGAGFLVDACPNATVYVHGIGAPHLADPSRLWEGTEAAVGDQIEFYTEPRPVPEDRIVELEDGDRIDLGDRELVVHRAPGHAPHQVVFEAPWMDAVFTADAAGIYAPSVDELHPTSPPPDFDLDRALADVHDLREMDPEWLLYGHFGPARTDDRLDEYESVLTEWVEAVTAKHTEFDDDEDVFEHFEETVETPDAWGERKGRAEVALNVRGVLRYLDEG